MFNYINSNNVLYSLVAGIASAFFVALIFFLLKEYVFNKPNLNGRFYLKIIINDTSYADYKEMELHFLLHMSTVNDGLIGGGERIYEDSSKGKGIPHVIHFAGNSKIPLSIRGSVSKNVFGKDVLNLMCEITAKSRISHMVLTFNLPFFYSPDRKESTDGRFSWSVAGKSGVAYLSRKPFHQKPAQISHKA